MVSHTNEAEPYYDDPEESESEDEDEDSDEDDEVSDEDEDEDEYSEAYTEDESQYQQEQEGFHDEGEDDTMAGETYQSGYAQDSYYDGTGTAASGSYYDNEDGYSQSAYTYDDGADTYYTGGGETWNNETIAEEEEEKDKYDREYERERRIQEEESRFRKYMLLMVCCCCCIVLILAAVLAILLTRGEDGPKPTPAPVYNPPTERPSRSPVTFPPVVLPPVNGIAPPTSRAPSPPTPQPTMRPTRTPSDRPTSAPTTSPAPTVSIPPTFVLPVQDDTTLEAGDLQDTLFSARDTLLVRSAVDFRDVNNTKFAVLLFDLNRLPRPLEELTPPRTRQAVLQLHHVPSVAAGSGSNVLRVDKLRPTRLSVNYLFEFMFPLQEQIEKGLEGPMVIVPSNVEDIAIDITDLIFAPLEPDAVYEGIVENPNNLFLMVHASPRAGQSTAFRSKESGFATRPFIRFDFGGGSVADVAEEATDMPSVSPSQQGDTRPPTATPVTESPTVGLPLETSAPTIPL